MTRDISSSGVLFLTPVEMHPGQRVRFTIALDLQDVEASVNLHCAGSVVRVVPEAMQFATAASIESFWFERRHESAAASPLGRGRAVTC